MTKRSKEVSVKAIALYFVKIQLCIIVSIIISIPVMITIRFFEHDQTIQTGIYGIVSVIIEFLCYSFMFYKEKYNDKTLELSFLLKATSLALIPHFILSLINRFYDYTIGPGVSSLAHFWGSLNAGEYLYKLSDVPLYTFLVLSIPMMALIVLSAYLGFRWGDKILQKERNELFENQGAPSRELDE